MKKLLAAAEECALISKLRTDIGKQELFAKLAELKSLLSDVERIINERQAREKNPGAPPGSERHKGLAYSRLLEITRLDPSAIPP